MTGINWASKRGGLGGHVPVSINKNSELRCPRCGGSDLHHGPASVFQRAKEDGPTTENTFRGLCAWPLRKLRRAGGYHHAESQPPARSLEHRFLV